MTDPLFEQLRQRIEGNAKALHRAADIFYSMVECKVTVPGQVRLDMMSLHDIEQRMIQRGIFFRQISLDDDQWWKVTTGKVLCFTREDNLPVILFPTFRSYSYVDPHTGKEKRLGRQDETFLQLFLPEAFSLTYPLPSRSLTLSDLGRMAVGLLSRADILLLIVACVSVMLMNMVSPYISKIIFSEVIPSGDSSQLVPMAVILFSAAVGLIMIQTTRSLIAFRLKDKMEYELQSGLMIRLLNQPTTAFKQYSPGDLATRVLSLSTFSGQLTDASLSAVLSLFISALLGIQLFIFGGDLLWLAILLLGGYILVVLANFYYIYQSRQQTLPNATRAQGLLFNIYSGIQKIKTCGAEVRALAQWAEIYRNSEYTSSAYTGRMSLTTALAYIAKYVVTLVIMVAAFYRQLSLSDYIAFMAVLAIAMNTVSALYNVMASIAECAPTLRLAELILQQRSVSSSHQIVVQEISGQIQINDLRFHYPGNENPVFDHLSLQIYPGEYVALVGRSGCGKSTLFRLILGFEEPESGSIFFDHYDLRDVNKSSLRRHCISTCLQDGRIIDGTVMQNICFTQPDATEEEAWEAARMAALDEDIRHMPDGMNTLLGTDGKSVSGGQRQRILIARALIAHPSIMLLDEATSALDNLSQKIVSDNLRRMGCTRLTIAHRLSTIRECDRIIVIDRGRVAEEGTFDQLLAQGGIFTELCKNQL